MSTQNKVKLIITADGSHSLFNADLNETYHSVHGAMQESIHVFIKNGLNFLIERSNPRKINILEMGFGTGLNALLTLQKSFESDVKMDYTTLEASPLQKDVWSQFNYSDTVGLKTYFETIHSTPWQESVSVSENFSLLKLHTTLQQVSLQSNQYDLIYYDAFAPNKQPELWEFSALKKVIESLNANGIFVTYCAKGQLKRDLKSLGLTVETLPGPPGKKEMVRAIR